MRKDKKKTIEREPYYFVDKYGMMLVKGSKDEGKGDSIGRTFDAYMATKDEKFIDAILDCYDVKVDNKGVLTVQAYRHPSKYDKDMSRDHVIYTLLALKLSGRDKDLKLLVDLLKWKISDRYTFTPDMWLWMKSLVHPVRGLWYAMAIPVSLVSVTWNNIIDNKVGKAFKEVHQKDYDYQRKSCEKYVKWRKKRFPAYALHLKLWQNYVMPKSPAKWLLNKILSIDIGEYNYLNKILAGQKVEKKDVNDYKAMTGGRWTTRLDSTNNRKLEIIKGANSKYLDVALLRSMYKK